MIVQTPRVPLQKTYFVTYTHVHVSTFSFSVDYVWPRDANNKALNENYLQA